VSELIQISALNQFLYCNRRAALIHVDGVFKHNEHTVAGELLHKQVDLPGYEHRAGWKLLRALPVFSQNLGLSGKADIVEVLYENKKIIATRPVEYKKGKVSKWMNDRVQLCAQALCLEEMFGIEVKEGMIFHAKSNKRTVVNFDAALRENTKNAVIQLHSLLESNQIPKAELKPQCEGCSLHEICLPEISSKAEKKMLNDLYKV